MTAAQWQEVLCRVRNLSAADKDRLLTYLHTLHDAAQQPQRVDTPRYCNSPTGLSAGFPSPIPAQSAEKISGTLIEIPA